MKKIAFLFIFSVLFLFAPVSAVFADGIIIPEPLPSDGYRRIGPFPSRPMIQLEILDHQVDVKINDHIATLNEVERV
jgi:hypothetical protein